MPDSIFDLVLLHMLDSRYDEAMFDLIGSDGSVKPVVVSKMVLPQNAKKLQAVYELKVEVLDGKGYFQQIFYDKDKKILQKLLYQDNSYAFEQTDVEALMRFFPEKEDRILYHLTRIENTSQ